MIHLRFYIHHGPNHQAIVKNGSVWLDVGMLSNLGHHRNKIHGCPDRRCSMMGPRSSIYALMLLTLWWGQCSPKILLRNATNPLHINNVEKNYSVIEKEVLAMVYVLHKFNYFCNSFIFFCSQWVSFIIASSIHAYCQRSLKLLVQSH